MTAPGPASIVGVTGGWVPAASRRVEEVDYTLVRRLRRQVAERLSDELVALRARRQADIGAADQRMLARALIDDALTAWVTDRVHDGEPAPEPAVEETTAAAVFAALFGLGRLQQWVDDEAIENIDVNGCDEVWLSYADGHTVRGPAVADTDEDLVEMIQSFAAYLGQSTREFSSARPLLNLRLPNGARLSAWMGVSPRPGLTIRRHRLTDISLHDLVALGSIDVGLAAFLRAAVLARKNIVVTGGVNAGKTTLVRALANEVDPDERIVVIEKEYELGLDRLPGRHHQVVCLEARDPNAEGSGEVPLAALVVHALRMNPRRIIVGEVRGDELIPMLTAMGSGNDGSLCTLHANSAHAAFNRMAAIGLASTQHLPVEAAHLLAADAVDLLVHVTLSERGTDQNAQTAHTDAQLLDASSTRSRFVSSVLEVTGIGENARVATNAIYRPGVTGRAVPATTPACLPDLMQAGFDPAYLDAADSWWTTPSALIRGSDRDTPANGVPR
jgi:pilus assembly protein CpaF